MIEIVAKKSTPKANTPAHSYIITELHSNKVRSRPILSFVEARKVARQLVIKSGYKRAYHVEDVGARRGYSDLADANVYYTGLYGCVVADYSNEDETILYQLKADGRHGYLLCSYDY